MARGRMIANQICRDKKIHDLSDDTSRLAFTWLITYADCEGRTYGDPAMVRSMLFPRREDITIEQMESYISEWEDAGLIERYEVDGDLYIWFPSFDKNQPGLRKDREPESTIPAPPQPEQTDDIRQSSGNHPEIIRQDADTVTDNIPLKLSEIKLINNNGAKKAPRKPREPNPQDESYYRLQDIFLEYTGLPRPVPKTASEYKEHRALWMNPGKTILSWVEYDEQKAAILVEDSVQKMQKDRLTIANFKSIIKVASDAFSKRNGNGHQ